MAFISMLLVLAWLGMLVFGAFCLVLSIVLALVNRKKHRRWVKIIAIISGILSAVNLAVGIGVWLFIRLAA